MKALVVVDCQNDFSDNGIIPVIRANQNAIKIKKLIDNLDRKEWKIIYCMDWHPHNHISFSEWKPHCIKNSYGAQLIKPLDEIHPDCLVKKGCSKHIEELSPFKKQHKSKIFKFLRKHYILDVYICGLVKEICVLETAIDALNLGFNTSLVSDLSVAINSSQFDKKYKKNKEIRLISSKIIRNSLL